MKVVYFVHDLNDAAVAKRVWMLRSAGADVTLFGFRRGADAPAQVWGVQPVDLGRTSDARLIDRAGSVLKALAAVPFWRERLAGADVVMARNLEVLVPAALARRLHAPKARLAYECLDVHRLMLSRGPAGAALRGIEGALLDRSNLLMVSSPAFLSDYFEPYQGIGARAGLSTLLVENKAFPALAPSITQPLPAGPPWRIGWYGMIRCRRSLDFLCDLARRRPDLVQVEIRGKPSYTEFRDFDRQVTAAPGVGFGGRYRPEDLPALYGGVHFNWALDYFQDEGNSRWLLPNRLYEGGRFGSPPISRLDCETGHWLKDRGLGVLFEHPEKEFEAFLDALTPSAYARLAERHRAAPKALFVMGQTDCDGLLDALAGDPERTAAPPVTPVNEQRLLLVE